LFYTGFMTVLKRLKTIKFEENKRHILQGWDIQNKILVPLAIKWQLHFLFKISI
jgi:hypothetical protein